MRKIDLQKIWLEIWVVDFSDKKLQSSEDGSLLMVNSHDTTKEVVGLLTHTGRENSEQGDYDNDIDEEEEEQAESLNEEPAALV